MAVSCYVFDKSNLQRSQSFIVLISVTEFLPGLLKLYLVCLPFLLQAGQKLDFVLLALPLLSGQGRFVEYDHM